MSYSGQSNVSISDAISIGRQDINLGRKTDEGSSLTSFRPTFVPSTSTLPEEGSTECVASGKGSPSVGSSDAASPSSAQSTPTAGPLTPAGPKRRVSIKHGKGESMMSFWAQGEKATTDAQRDKKKADDLQRQLETALEMLKDERENAAETERKYLDLVRKLHTPADSIANADHDDRASEES